MILGNRGDNMKPIEIFLSGEKLAEGIIESYIIERNENNIKIYLNGEKLKTKTKEKIK